MRKFPQPNYVISKVAEEAGEVVKAAIHCAEGRETPENVIAEIKQAMAMLLRLYVEGDQVHGLPPLKAAMEAGLAKCAWEAATVTDRDPVYKTVVRSLRTLQHVVESPSTRWNALKDGALGCSKIIER